MSFNAIFENKIIAKISESTVQKRCLNVSESALHVSESALYVSESALHVSECIGRARCMRGIIRGM